MFERGEKIKSTKNGNTYVVTCPTKDNSEWVDVRTADMTAKRFTGALNIAEHKFERVAA